MKTEVNSFASKSLAAANEVLLVLLRIRDADDDELPPAEDLQRSIRDLLNEVRTKLLSSGFSTENTTDVLYALVAFTDEIVLARKGPLRTYWLSHLLQVAYFHGHNAGEEFFSRLEKQKRGPRGSAISLVYYTCLLLGFRGRHSGPESDDDLAHVVERTRIALMRLGVLDKADGPSTYGKRPYEQPHPQGKALGFSLIAFTSSAILYSILLMNIQSSADLISTKVKEAHASLEQEL